MLSRRVIACLAHPLTTLLRERREVFLANKDDKTTPGRSPENERGREVSTDGQLDLSVELARVRALGRAAAPEALIDGIDALHGEKAERMMDVAILDPNLEPLLQRIAAQKGFPPEAESWTPAQRQALLASLLESPSASVRLAEALDGAVTRYEEISRVTEVRMKDLISEAGPENDPDRWAAVDFAPLAQALADNNAPVDETALAELLHLETTIPDAAERQELLAILVQRLKSVRRKLRYGIKGHPETSAESEGSTEKAWQKDQVKLLTRSRDAMCEYVQAVLDRESEAFAQRDGEALQDIVAELGTELFDESGALSEDAERACLVTHGVSLAEIVGAMSHRASALEELDVPPPTDPTFLTRANEKLSLIRKLSLQQEQMRREPAFIAPKAVREQRDAEAWAFDLSRRLRRVLQFSPTQRDALKPLLSALAKDGEDPWETLATLNESITSYGDTDGSPAALAALRKNYPDCVTTTQWPAQQRAALTSLIDLLEKQDVDTLDAAATAATAPEQQPGSSTIDAERERLRASLSEVLGGLVPSLKHPLCDTLGVPDAMARKKSDIEQKLVAGSPVDAEMARQDIQRLEQAKGLLDRITSGKAVVETDDETVLEHQDACYDYDSGTMYIRSGLPPERKKELYEHERGHAILHVLTRQSRAFPMLLSSAYESLRQRHADQSGADDFGTALEKLGASYRLEQQRATFKELAAKKYPDDADKAAAHAETLYREFLLEELLNRHADRLATGKAMEGRAGEAPLFQLVNDWREETAAQVQADDNADGEPDKVRRLKLFSTEAYDEGDLGEHDQDDTRKADVSARNPKQELINMGRQLYVISSFIEAYEDHPDREKLKEIFAHLSGLHAYYDAELRKPDKETDLKFLEEMTTLGNAVSKVSEEVRKIDTESLDTTDARRVKKPGFWDHVHFLSINDMVKLWKDTWEDIGTMYKRNQERTLQEVGDVLTEALGKGKNLPFRVGTYLNKLKGYHTRRYAQSELDSVGKWQDALKKEDSHTVIELLAHTKNKDQIRGILALLSDRGELDWESEDIWHKLEDLSGYKMPEKACKRDDVLRDTWLRKMITEIWNDKELYYHWRGANDSNTASGKKHFTPTVDQLSNVGGGMSGELFKQLKLYKQWKALADENHHKGLGHPPFPVDVKPHLYEEIIDYAIRDGKMTMEAKMFYLVQGVASGLLSIDRLRALAGEHGGIINSFPFIEYFYQKNNTLPELKKIAADITEDFDENNPTAIFKPGTKTTLWIHYKVAREESVRARLSKGSTRSAEGIDHEDIPFLITQMDYKEADNLLDVISGSRQKVTPEGWKNAYVGFNSKMKIFGCLAQLEKEGIDKFTLSDAKMLASNLASYIYMDNVLTLNGAKEKGTPPNLSQGQFRTPCPSGASGTVAWDYRRSMTAFLGAMSQAGIFKDIDWEKVDKDKTIGEKEMIATNPDEYKRNTDDKIQKKLLNFSAGYFPRFVEELEKAILKNPQRFKDILADFALRAPNQGGFLNEGGSEELNYENVKAVTIKGQSAMQRKASGH